MSLKQQTFKVSNIETKDYDDVHFIPAVVDDKEVYEVKNSSNIHCGYVTEAFLEALTKVNDEEGRVNRNFVVRQTQEWAGDITLSKGGDITLLSRKIILDAPKDPSKILVQGIVLRPTIYPEEMENKALTIATSCFRIMSPFCPLDIKVNHYSLEAEAFSIVRVGGTADKSVTIDLDLATNKVGDLNIDGFYGESAFGGPYLKLKCTNEEVAPDITILGYTIDGNTNDKSEAGYIHFETAGEFAAREGRAYMPKTYAFNGKEPSKIVSKKDGIFLMNSNITLKSDDDLSPVSLVTNGKILLKETDAVLTGKNDIDGIFRCDPTAKQTRKSSVWMRYVASESGIYLKSKNSSECIFRLGNSYLSNGEKDIVIKGESSLVGVRLDNSMKSKELTLENVNIRYSILSNISDLKNAKISNSEVENFNLTNKSKDTQSFCFGLGTIAYNDINEFYSPKEGADIDKTIYSSIKNTKITLWEGDWFHDKVGKGLDISNSVIEGNYTIETIYRNRNKTVPINIENSSLTRGALYIEKDFSVDDKPISIINSDIDYNVAAINLDLIEASVIKGGVRFNGVREIKDAMIDQVNFEDSKINKIEGGSYLANGKTIEGRENTKTGKITEDLEIL
nr:MAG TPA: hypothetical protein [Caudoviricetes sp.]